MSFGCQKGEFDRFFNRLDRPVKEVRPDRQPDRLVDPTGFHLCLTLSMFSINVLGRPLLSASNTNPVSINSLYKRRIEEHDGGSFPYLALCLR